VGRDSVQTILVGRTRQNVCVVAESEFVRPLVRLAGRHEASELAVLHRRTAIAGYGHIFPPEAPPPTEAEVLAQWEHWLGADWDRGRRAFVAADGGDLIGVVLAGPDPDDARRGQLARLYVSPERWGEGVGRQLYDAAIGHLHDQGFTTVTLWVLEENRRARSWYERLGWRPNGTRKTTYAPAGIEDVGYELTFVGLDAPP
jgi:ribosomal protein S18 acetylase RimI-like enzyme